MFPLKYTFPFIVFIIISACNKSDKKEISIREFDLINLLEKEKYRKDFISKNGLVKQNKNDGDSISYFESLVSGDNSQIKCYFNEYFISIIYTNYRFKYQNMFLSELQVNGWVKYDLSNDVINGNKEIEVEFMYLFEKKPFEIGVAKGIENESVIFVISINKLI